MKIKFLSIAVLTFLFASCINSQKKNSIPNFENKGHELIYKMAEKVGNYQKLAAKKDVVYTYTYQTPDGKTDIATEKYIFNGELSYAAYTQHERTYPQLNGLVEQSYDGETFWLKNAGEYLTDESMMKRVKFSRPTNFYWFTMMQKLLDPGLIYEHLGEQKKENNTYDIVKVSFNSTDDKPTDIYQLYINQETSLVDYFLFTVVDFGVNTPNLMVLEYEKIDGFLIPTKRKYKKSNWEADVTEEPWINVTWSDIKFNNGLSKDDFR
jgi:hypothetical protein